MSTLTIKNKTIFFFSGIIANFFLFYFVNFLLGFLVNVGVNDSLAIQIILFIYLVLPIILLLIGQRKDVKYRYLALGCFFAFVILIFGVLLLDFPFSLSV